MDLTAGQWRAGGGDFFLGVGYFGGYLNIVALLSWIKAPGHHPSKHCCTRVAANHPNNQRRGVPRTGNGRKDFFASSKILSDWACTPMTRLANHHS